MDLAPVESELPRYSESEDHVSLIVSEVLRDLISNVEVSCTELELGSGAYKLDKEESLIRSSEDVNTNSSAVTDTDQESSSTSTKRKAEDEQSLQKKKRKTLGLEEEILESQPGPSQLLEYAQETVSVSDSIYQNLADTIVAEFITTFDKVVNNDPIHKYFTVASCIAMTKNDKFENPQIISFGTGSKCIKGTYLNKSGCSLNDCHAEIISRRGLKSFFYDNLELHLKGQDEKSIFEKNNVGRFRLKSKTKFHLFINTPPCGDARTYSMMKEKSEGQSSRIGNKGALRTKIDAGGGTFRVKKDPSYQNLDEILSGKERLRTASCSDKINYWNVLGLQGCLLSQFIEPIYLDSIILGEHFNEVHLRRAVYGRIEDHIINIPPPFKLNKPKLCLSSSPLNVNSPNFPKYSLNWTLGLEQPEIIRQKTGRTYDDQTSRIARRTLFSRYLHILSALSPSDESHMPPQQSSYSHFKMSIKDYTLCQKALEEAFISAGLGRWIKKPVELNNFE